jgi:DNA-binding MarR family transcriptional regulator
MSVEIDSLPGYNIRRLQQIAVAIFLEETQGFGITPVQYAALQAVGLEPRIDQRTLARTIGFDTSTIGSVIDRLESRGLMQRNAHPEDRRVRLLTITPDGQQLLDDAEASVQRAQERMLQPLAPEQRPVFMDMLRTLVRCNNALSRAPSALAEEPPQRRSA